MSASGLIEPCSVPQISTGVLGNCVTFDDPSKGEPLSDDAAGESSKTQPGQPLQVTPPPVRRQASPPASRSAAQPPKTPPRVSPAIAAPPVPRAPVAPGAVESPTRQGIGSTAAAMAARESAQKRRRSKTPAGDSSNSAQQNLVQQEAQRRKTPSWLASLVLHLVLLLVLALVPIRKLTSGPLTFFMGDSSGDVASEFELADDAMDASELMETTDTSPIETLNAAEPLKQLELPTIPDAAPVESPPILNTNKLLESLPFGITSGLSGRRGSTKAALLQRFGGTAETEAAVDMGLAWLARQQESNGSWSLLGPYSSGGALENRTAATAMAINAFLGAGNTPDSGTYANHVRLGLAYLVNLQNRDGMFSENEPSRQQMYAQAIAAIAVIEAYGMTRDPKFEKPAQKAIEFAEWSQSKLRGWRYVPREDADLSVTGWFVMTLETGKMAGLKVDERKLAAVSSFLDSVSHEDYTRYAYTDSRSASLSMTAEGLLCRIYLGWSRTHPSLLAAIRDDLLENIPSAQDPATSVYYWYYATQVLHHVGGKPWTEWNDAMKEVLPGLQTKQGKEKGSWDPNSDLYGPAGGRLYTTCLTLYCLEVYYRHLAIYDLDE